VLGRLGYDVKPIAPETVRPFVKRGKKNDGSDAAATVAAATRPKAKFVPAKTSAQGVLSPHSARSLLAKQHTMLANAMRSRAAGLGFIRPRGTWNVEELTSFLQRDGEVPELARRVFRGLLEQFRIIAARWALNAENAAERYGARPVHHSRRRAGHCLADCRNRR
jgi:error-prone DNA polymerase